MQNSKQSSYYTHQCGSITRSSADRVVTVVGWIDTLRDHGSLIFLDLRDSSGKIQCVVEEGDPTFATCNELSLESVIKVTGTVKLRPQNTFNEELSSGEVEIRLIHSLEVLSIAETLPFALHQPDVNEELRLKYRFLDLRRSEMQERLRLRADTVRVIRAEMEKLGFIEVHTPLLTCSSPEGARDYVVPSRLHKGKFFALPQSPQQFKQLLMVGGVPRYYQIAPCFRDEDTRADRAPGAFYQLDLEMAFVTQNEVLEVVETVIYNTFAKLSNFKRDSLPFRQLTYKEAMARYASDKPDLRNPLEFTDVRSFFERDTPEIFREIISQDGMIYMMLVENLHLQPRSFFQSIEEHAKSLGAKGLGYCYRHMGELKGPMSKLLLNNPIQEEIYEGYGVFIIAHGDKREFYRIANGVRNYVGEELDLIEKNAFRFCWIVDFPMYERGLSGEIDFSHNPFSMPQDLEALSGDPLDILAYQYDIVCNGIELSSGAIRNHRPDVMYRVFEIAGYSKEEVDQKFGAMINAFQYGAPPHGGCAPGIDRIVMLLAGVENVREIIPFPLNQQGVDLMMNAPTSIPPEHLKELSISIEERS